MALARAVYAGTASMPTEERYGLTSQLRRAAVSVPSNIAEGHGRSTDRAFAVFLTQARDSLFELQTQVELSPYLHLPPKDVPTDLLLQSEQLAWLMNGLLRKLRTGGPTELSRADSPTRRPADSL